MSSEVSAGHSAQTEAQLETPGQEVPAEPMVEPSSVAGNSLVVAVWTIISRVTGVARVVAIAAVLGPTYLGNTYQAINHFPHIVYYGFLAGSLFPSLLVPPLVRHVDRKDRAAVERVARGFMGVAIVAFGAVTLLIVLAGPLVLGLLASNVDDPSVAAAQQRVGWPLLAMLMPQVLLYGVAGTAGAVLNAHGRFALAAGAPALENLAIVTTLVAWGWWVGTGTELGAVQLPQLLLLGLGTTAAVALHAATQWAGARRVGVSLVPRLGWRDHEVREVIRRAIPSIGHAGLGSLPTVAALIVANGVRGGVVAFQMAINFFALPVAIGARPIAVALLPRLSRLFHAGNGALFRDELTRGLALSFFLTVPAAVAYIALSVPLARAVAFGEMATPRGVTMIAASLAALAVGILGHTSFVLGAHASYAQHDARSPLISVAVQTVAALAGMLFALAFSGTAVLVALGLSFSIAQVIGTLHLWTRPGLRVAEGRERATPSFVRALVASVVMSAPAYLVAVFVADSLGGQLNEIIAMVAAVIVGAATFLAVEKAWNSPELSYLLAGFTRSRSGSDG